MRLIGLTGGIASGKSTVSQELQAKGLPVVDADKIAHAALKKDTWGYKRVVRVFGKGILRPDGEVDRAKLGDIVFSDPEKRKQLNDALGPAISYSIFCAIFNHWIYGTKVLILDVPLLFERGIHRFTNPVVVVWVDKESEEKRLMERDGISKEQAVNRINAQLCLDWKRDRADIVIDNSGSIEETKQQIIRIFQRINGDAPTWKETILSRNFSGTVISLAVIGVCYKLLLA